MLDFRLHTFMDLCASKSYTKTAKNLHMTQPAVSQHIRYLENYYGVKLIHYEKRKMSLTKEGEYLFKSVTGLLESSRIIRRGILSLGQKTPPVSVGAVPAVGEFILPHLTAEYEEKYAFLNIHSVIGRTDTLERKMRAGELDFAVVDSEKTCPELPHCLIGSQQICCVCSPAHPLAWKSATFKELTNQNIIYWEKDSHAYRILNEKLKRQGLTLNDFSITVQSDSMVSILSYLKETPRISFLFKSVIKEKLDKGELAEIYIDSFHESEAFYCIYTDEIQKKEQAAHFMEFCISRGIGE